MIKEFKKRPHKISRMAILSCIVATTVVLTNSVTVRALDSNNTTLDTATNTVVSTKEEAKFLIDSPLKVYDDIKKVEKVAGFKFKIPDFLPSSNKAEADSLQVIKLSDKDNVLHIYLDGNINFTFQVSKKDPLEYLKKIETEKNKLPNLKVESEEQSMKLGELNGFCVTVTTTAPAETMENGYIRRESQDVDKYFAWKNEGLWYSIKYNSIFKTEGVQSKQELDISQDNIEKIANSITYPEEIKNVNYSVEREVSTEVGVMDIYDKEDLEKAKNILGFNPKFPLKISKDININGAGIGISGDSDIKNNKINYEINNFYSYKNSSITFNQGKTSKNYDDIKKNGYFIQVNTEDNKPKQIKAEKLNISNNEVFKYEENDYGHSLSYDWKENDIYYSVIFFDETEDSDEIVKEFVNSKSID